MHFAEKLFTVLIADDDSDDILFTQKAFQDLGFRAYLQTVKNGEELLIYLDKYISDNDPHLIIPDLILLDLNMPVKNGWETLEKIRSLKRLRDISVVIWTANESDKDRLRSIEMGADYYITKPRGYTDLLSCISFLLKIFCGFPRMKEVSLERLCINGHPSLSYL